MPNITNEQLQELQRKVTTLVTDRQDADDKTQVSHQKDTALAVAQAEASQAKMDEAAADGKVSTDLTDLQHFIDNIANPQQPPTDPVPTDPTTPPTDPMPTEHSAFEKKRK